MAQNSSNYGIALIRMSHLLHTATDRLGSMSLLQVNEARIQMEFSVEVAAPCMRSSKAATAPVTARDCGEESAHVVKFA
jgi:hypothetical protein